MFNLYVEERKYEWIYDVVTRALFELEVSKDRAGYLS